MARSINEEPGLRAYVTTIEREPILDREEELELARRFRAGDQDAGDALVRSHLRSVVRVARKYGGYGIQLSELVGEGNIGLLEALRRFEPERGLRFLTYARYWVRAYVLAHVLKHWSIVDMGTTALQSKMFFRLQAEHARLVGELGEADAVAERLAEKFDTTPDHVRDSLSRLARRDRSLDAPLTEEGGVSLLDTLRAHGASQEEVVASTELASLVHGAVARAWPSFDDRERLIVRERLLAGGDAKSLAELGKVLGVTRERVRQIEAGTKVRLRAAFRELSSSGQGAGAVAPQPSAA